MIVGYEYTKLKLSVSYPPRTWFFDGLFLRPKASLQAFLTSPISHTVQEEILLAWRVCVFRDEESNDGGTSLTAVKERSAPLATTQRHRFLINLAPGDIFCLCTLRNPNVPLAPRLFRRLH